MFPPNTKHFPIPEARRPEHGLLLVVAAPTEADAIRRALGPYDREADPHSDHWVLERLAQGVDLIETGVGKAQAAGGTAWAFDPARHTGVLSLGIAGALPPLGPHGQPCPIGSAILATRSVLADEGVRTRDTFIEIASVGFPPGCEAGGFGTGGRPCSPDWADPLGGVCDQAGVIATVSSCSGTDSAAVSIARRTGAIAETMEGAAVAASLSRIPPTNLDPAPDTPIRGDDTRSGTIGFAEIRFAEIRVISNTTGDRDRQVWDLPASLERLGSVAAEAVAALERHGP